MTTDARWLHWCEGARGAIRFQDAPLPWQRAGLQQTASGYGRRLTSTRVAVLPNGQRRRVYVTQYSNAGTAWITVGGKVYTVSECCEVRR